jgi:hypothetical protein
MRRLLVLIVIALAVATVRAQSPSGATAVPVLTDTQKLAYQALVSRALGAQVQALLAQRELDRAQREMAALLAAWHKPGYVLDPQTLTYTGRVEETKTGGTVPPAVRK